MKLPRKLTLKDGTVFDKGTSFRLACPNVKNPDILADIEINGRALTVRYRSILAMPSESTLRRWIIMDAVAPTIDGCRVEPDGHCEHGYPAIPMALGYI